MAFLDPGGSVRRYHQTRIAKSGEFLTFRPGHADDPAAEAAGRHHGRDHVWRVATRADGDQTIAFRGQRLDLPREDAVKIIIVGERR